MNSAGATRCSRPKRSAAGRRNATQQSERGTAREGDSQRLIGRRTEILRPIVVAVWRRFGRQASTYFSVFMYSTAESTAMRPEFTANPTVEPAIKRS